MRSGIVYIIGVLALTTGLFTYMNYEEEALVVSGRPVVNHVLEVDLTDPRVRLDHGYSFDLLYGFETTSEIAVRTGAVAAVNGMFYDDLGMPIGIIIDEGKPVRIHNAGTPVVLVGENGETVMTEVVSNAMVYVGKGYAWLYSVNGRVPDGSWGYMEPVFGKTTRIHRPSVNYIIRDGVISEIVHSEGPVSLAGCDGILVYAGNEEVFGVGQSVVIDFDLGFDAFPVETAFQAGGWLVKNGVNVAMDEDPFVGYTTAPQPRTLVGIKKDGHMLFVVVDGRQPGYSIGVSGKEAAALMIEYGCVSAAFLDGGASSTLWYEGEVVNRPSGETERAVAHVLLIKDILTEKDR